MARAVFLILLFLLGAGASAYRVHAADEKGEVITIEGDLPEGEEYRQKFQDKLDGTLRETKEAQDQIRRKEEKDRLDEMRKKQTNIF